MKELLPILMAALAWGRAWCGQKVLCHCDNQVVVAAIQSRSSAQPQIMHLLRCLFFIEALSNFSLVAEYITSEDNSVADALSRDDLHTFLLKVPVGFTHRFTHKQQKSYWTHTQTGPHQPGCSGSGLFS